MKNFTLITIVASICTIVAGCTGEKKENTGKITADSLSTDSNAIIQPVIVTEPTQYDTDDPCIWVNPNDKSKSIIFGTDKDADGALYAYDLNGKIIKEKVIKGLKRPNNVDLEYGFKYGDTTVDIVLIAERLTHQIKVYSVPDMKYLGAVEAFKGEAGNEFRALMGIAAYKSPSDSSIYAIIGRKNGPTDGTYLWQYKLSMSNDSLKGELVRKFGVFSGKKEIEAIAVDNKLGYVYCSDEGVGVRKYYAHPDSSSDELALFATEGIKDDHEGISIYELDDYSGYILVSDQQAGEFHIYPREGSASNPHEHPLMKVVKVAALESDGSETSSFSLNDTFDGGLFVAMSEGKVFHYYKWSDIAGEKLKVRK